MSEPDYYGQTGVDRNATLDATRSEFRAKVLIEHPVKGGDAKKSLLLKAHNISFDQEKSKLYDSTGRAEKSAAEEFVISTPRRQVIYLNQLLPSGDAPNIDEAVSELAVLLHEHILDMEVLWVSLSFFLGLCYLAVLSTKRHRNVIMLWVSELLILILSDLVSAVEVGRRKSCSVLQPPLGRSCVPAAGRLVGMGTRCAFTAKGTPIGSCHWLKMTRTSATPSTTAFDFSAWYSGCIV